MCVHHYTLTIFFIEKPFGPNEYETIDYAILQLIFNKFSIHKFTHLNVEPMKSLIYTNGFPLFKIEIHAIKDETDEEMQMIISFS